MYEIIFQSLGFILILIYDDSLSYGFNYITILWHILMDFKPGWNILGCDLKIVQSINQYLPVKYQWQKTLNFPLFQRNSLYNCSKRNSLHIYKSVFIKRIIAPFLFLVFKY